VSYKVQWYKQEKSYDIDYLRFLAPDELQNDLNSLMGTVGIDYSFNENGNLFRVDDNKEVKIGSNAEKEEIESLGYVFLSNQNLNDFLSKNLTKITANDEEYKRKKKEEQDRIEAENQLIARIAAEKEAKTQRLARKAVAEEAAEKANINEIFKEYERILKLAEPIRASFVASNGTKVLTEGEGIIMKKAILSTLVDEKGQISKNPTEEDQEILEAAEQAINNAEAEGIRDLLKKEKRGPTPEERKKLAENFEKKQEIEQQRVIRENSSNIKELEKKVNDCFNNKRYFAGIPRFGRPPAREEVERLEQKIKEYSASGNILAMEVPRRRLQEDLNKKKPKYLAAIRDCKDSLKISRLLPLSMETFSGGKMVKKTKKRRNKKQKKTKKTKRKRRATRKK